MTTFIVNQNILIMKKLTYLLLSLFIMGLVSCSSDDDSNPHEVSLLGEWYADEFRMVGSYTEEGQTYSFDGLASNCVGNDITFNADQSVTGHNAPFSMTSTVEVPGMPPITSTMQMSSFTSTSGEWSREGNTLYLQEEGSSHKDAFTILLLNATTLKIMGDQNSIDPGDWDSGTECTATLTYKR